MIYSATYHGLHEWYKAMFERSGWMILALKHGNQLKYDSFVQGLVDLIDTLQSTRKQLHDVDKKRDLLILETNSKILLDHVKSDSKKRKRRSKKIPSQKM